MDVKTVALLSGVNPDSVLDYKQVKGVDILRIDLNKEPELRRSIEARTAGKASLPDGDIFETDRTVDGTARAFEPEYVLKDRQLNFVDPDLPGQPSIPGWRLIAHAYSPNATYGAVVETLGFFTFDRHSGSKTYDFSEPNEHMTRPWARYSLGYVDEANQLRMVSVQPSAGQIEVNHIDTGENAMELSGAFAQVQFEMPNIHEHLPQAPNRGFVVRLIGGLYRLNGSW